VRVVLMARSWLGWGVRARLVFGFSVLLGLVGVCLRLVRWRLFGLCLLLVARCFLSLLGLVLLGWFLLVLLLVVSLVTVLGLGLLSRWLSVWVFPALFFWVWLPRRLVVRFPFFPLVVGVWLPWGLGGGLLVLRLFSRACFSCFGRAAAPPLYPFPTILLSITNCQNSGGFFI